jgi:hypothetical protein
MDDKKINEKQHADFYYPAMHLVVTLPTREGRPNAPPLVSACNRW